MKIDGGLEARHFLADSPPSDWRLVHRGDAEIRVGGLADLVWSKELLRRAKDVQRLALLYERFLELAPGSQP